MLRITKSYSKFLVLFVLLNIFLLLFTSKHIFAANWVKYPSNPVLSAGSTTWDSFYVRSASVVKEIIGYSMWYEADGGNGGFQNDNGIGYSHSIDGLPLWNRFTQRAISPSSVGNWEKATPEPFVLYNPTGPIYKMWYTSLNSDSWSVGLDRFRTRYATSTDGINWTPGDWVMYGTPGKWDAGGTGRGRTVIYNGGTYHMWYAGTDTTSLGSDSYWRIGYATSPDGITWHKENGGNPVIEPTKSWEFNTSLHPTSGYPTVILVNGVYHMWYATGIGDDTSNIAYAYSKDGINWTKPDDQNPVLQKSPGTFDRNNLFPSTVFIDGPLLKMWYSGYDGTNWRIGYATADAATLPNPYPLPPTKQVIVIPGATASWNADALLNCKPDGYTGSWSLIGPAHAIYDPLIQSLSDAGWTPKLFTYDWRKKIVDTEVNLKSFIDAQTISLEKVNIVGHSEGGLVGRSYLKQEQSNNKAEKLLTIAAPHQGAVPAYPTWSAGEVWSDNPYWKAMVTIFIKRCSAITHNDRLSAQQFFPAVRNILPIFDYLTDEKTGVKKPVASMNAKNDWLSPTSFTSPFWNTIVGSLTGTGQKTPAGYRVTPPTKRDQLLGNWSDGKPNKTLTSMDGDGTVLVSSSRIIGADNQTIIGDHNGIVSSGIPNILSFLGTPNIAALNVATQNHKNPTSQKDTSALFIVGYPADFRVVDPKGHITTSNDSLVSYSNPIPGNYRMLLNPKDKQTVIIIVQVLPDGRVLYKEYKDTNRLPKIHVVKYDEEHPEEDSMH